MVASLKRTLGLVVGLCLLASCRTPEPRTNAVVSAKPTAFATAGKRPTGLGFDLFVPAGWAFTQKPGPSSRSEGDGRAETQGPEVTLTTPNGALSLAIRVVDGATNADAAVARAWQALRREAPAVSQRTVSDAGLYDEVVEYTYASAPSEHWVVQALATRKGAKTLVLIADGAGEEANARGALLGQVLESVDLPGMVPPEEDLSAKAPVALDAEKTKVLEAFVARVFAASQVPGFAVALVQGDRIVFEAGYGVRSRGETQGPVSAKTRFLIGSTTKSMTTLLLAKRVEEGAFTWDTPAVAVMPSFRAGDPSGGKAFRIKDLVCACTGLPRQDFPMIFEFENHGVRELFSELATLAPTTGFRETYQYNNQIVAAAGFVAAYSLNPKGDLLETYAQAMQQKVFGPIGMKDTTVRFRDGETTADHAMPHGTSLDGAPRPFPLAAEGFLIPFAPSGGAWSTAHDLGLYLLEELHRGKNAEGKSVVAKEQVEARWAPQVSASSTDSYALGWGVGRVYGLRFVDHSGATLGFESRLSFFPDHGLGIAMVANGTLHVSAGRLIRRRFVELAFGAAPRAEDDLARAVKEDAERLAKRAALYPSPRTSDAAKAILGTYQNPRLGTITVRLEAGDRVVLDAGEWTSELRPAGPGTGVPAWVFAGPILTGLPLAVENGDLVLETGNAREHFTRRP